jgi:hypothetical protein
VKLVGNNLALTPKLGADVITVSLMAEPSFVPALTSLIFAA